MHTEIEHKAKLKVTPFVGVWIETAKINRDIFALMVTPFVGVWIETCQLLGYHHITQSHPSWVCGLKHIYKG